MDHSSGTEGNLVDPIAAMNNYLLPLWMIIFGVSLVRYRASIPEIASHSTWDSRPLS